ncbi:MAG: OsmC family protein [Longimicrobiales bacterium]|nr:OsmC family protein [Longimicrobiales bacterium]
MAGSRVSLEWVGQGLAFRGSAPGGPVVTVDGDGSAGASPMQSLLLSVAACMGIDIVMILEKGRVPLTGLAVEVDGDRAEDPPRRFTALRMTVRLAGPAPEDRGKVERAVALSRERYCSVLHSLSSDLPLDIRVELS